MTPQELSVVINRYLTNIPPIDVQINDEPMFYIGNWDMFEAEKFIADSVGALNAGDSIKKQLKSDIIKSLKSANCLDRNISAVQKRIQEIIHSAMTVSNSN